MAELLLHPPLPRLRAAPVAGEHARSPSPEVTCVQRKARAVLLTHLLVRMRPPRHAAMVVLAQRHNRVLAELLLAVLVVNVSVVDLGRANLRHAAEAADSAA